MAKNASFKQQAKKPVKSKLTPHPAPFGPDGWNNVPAVLAANGWTQTPGTPETPGTPGVRKYTDPFMTTEDFFAQGTAKGNDAIARQQVDNDIAALQVQTDQSKLEIGEAFKKNTSATVDDMIGRGLLQSSIKDSALYDLEAQKGIQETFLATQFNSAVLRGQKQKDVLDDVMRRFNEDMDRKMVDNAATVDEGSDPQWVTPPTAGTAAVQGGWSAPTLAKPTIQQAKFAPVKTAPATSRLGGAGTQQATFTPPSTKKVTGGLTGKLQAPKAPKV